ncbi:MAG: tetratricopeptide repeat protein [Bacteroidetes bacterium]|nr:tetratricopeptide repeat protein [Bacteroidota bacterium]
MIYPFFSKTGLNNCVNQLIIKGMQDRNNNTFEIRLQMKKCFYIKCLFLLFFTQQYFYLPAQDHQSIDSVRNFVKSTSNDTAKISGLIMLSKHYQDNNSDKAFDYGKQALTFSVQLNNLKGMGEAYNNLGDLYWYKGDYGASSVHYFKALKIYEDLQDNGAIANCYRNIGWIYYYQKKYPEALNYYNKSLIINQKLKMKGKMGQNYSDMGTVYAEQKKFNDAIKSYSNALGIVKESNNKEGMTAIYGNMSIVYEEMGKLDLAIQTSEKSIKIAEEIGSKRYLSGNYSILGSLYVKAKRYDAATFALKKALNLSKEIKDKRGIIEVYGNFSKLFEKQNDFKKALEYAQLTATLTDSVYNENNNRQANEMTTKYESEKKELMIAGLEKDKALSDEKFQREKNFKIYLLIFLLFIASFAFVLFRGNVQKRKANIALSFAYEEIELKNKDISDSINYSKRIQDASLAPKELKYKLFPDTFVLFRPKDIVSGDFYWYAEKDGKKLIAACDCTGHGVPGALMSMIGNNILYQIVNERGITAADEILNHLHKEVRKALKQEEHGATRDGMDIALISFNSETEIEYAGAQRPLWILKKIKNGELKMEPTMHLTSSGFELSEIKPDKFSIGGYQSEIERKFTKHKISLSKGDCIYIFSDGFVDQFGGKEGKKFMSKRFKDLLLANYSTPMLEQENTLTKTFETWKGSREQVDDLLVIGIRI